MRPCLPLLLSVAAFPAMAQGVDCAALRATDMPFAITYDVVTRTGDGAVTATTQQVQVFRKAGRTVIYTVQPPGIYLRTRGPNLLFPLE